MRPTRHSQLSLLPEEFGEFDAVDLSAYQTAAESTDRLKKGGIGPPLLGLFGEAGSLLSALKKKQRDKASFNKYNDAVYEELGDCLWYFSLIASRSGLQLPVLAQRMFRDFEDWDEVDPSFGSFGDIQGRMDTEVSETEFNSRALALAGYVGDLINDYRIGALEGNRDKVSAHLVDVFKALVAAADAAGVALDEAARLNLKKIFSRWPHSAVYPARFDKAMPENERFPDILEFSISEEVIGSKACVVQRYSGEKIGDSLTDNKAEKDDYRFHDVFHLAFLTHLGWSPVLRALLKKKRKSQPGVDEDQDGARAILIEEGVATFIFGRGLELGLFKGIDQVDYDLLKFVQEFVKGYEVEQCELWQWERAILDGFRVFRSLVETRRGRVIADIVSHKLDFKEL